MYSQSLQPNFYPQQQPGQGGNYQPSANPNQQQGFLDAGMLQPSAVNAQMQMLRNQQMQQPQTTTGVDLMQQYATAISPYVTSLENMAKLAGIQATAIQSMYQEMNHLYEINDICNQALKSLSLVLNQLKAQEELTNVLHSMIASPEWMVLTTFGLLKQVATGNQTENAGLELISELYLEFVADFEEKRRALYGQYSPQYLKYLESELSKGNQQPTNYRPTLDQGNDQYVNMVRSLASKMNTPVGAR